MPWKDTQIFMVNEYFHIHRAFMGHSWAMKIMNPLNSKPWKSRFYFHGIIHSPWITHEILDLESVNFHGIFKGIWWVLHNVRDFMGHEYGNIHRIFMPFLMHFSYFFHAINPMKKAMKNPMKNLWKGHEFIMN